MSRDLILATEPLLKALLDSEALFSSFSEGTDSSFRSLVLGEPFSMSLSWLSTWSIID